MSSQNKAKKKAVIKVQTTAVHKAGGKVPRTQQIKFKQNNKRKENRDWPISKTA